ncbi:MAG: zinc-binding dehydrogenase [Chloroflexi bacterium]|nr:zinc-binding dehydrogenase [Chloroflexota bacterium]
MKALVLREYGKDLALEEIVKPEPRRDEIILKVSYCGLCGTDLKIASGKLSSIIKLPHVPGHEIVGRVESVGAGVRGLKEGDHGVAYFYVSCGVCEMCRSGKENICATVERLGFERYGGFAEYVRLPAYNVCTYEGTVAEEKMAVLPDAIATPYHALKTVASARIGQFVLIVGIGGLGIHAVQIAKHMGCIVVGTDRRKEVMQKALAFGADLVVNPDEADVRESVMRFTGGRGVDVVIENVGTDETIQWSVSCLKRGGVLVIVGYDPLNPIGLNGMTMLYNEWTIRGSRVSTRQELVEVIHLVQTGKIDPVVTKVIKLEDVNLGLAELKDKKNVGRLVVKVG